MDLDMDTWVVVADGERYLLLRNRGDRGHMHLEVVDHGDSPNPPARALASDRPGRRHDAMRDVSGRVAAWGTSAMEQTDWHRLAEALQVEDLTGKLADWAGRGRFHRLVVVADPRSLGTMRARYNSNLKSVIVAEIAKDLTKLPLAGIEASIRAWQPG